MKGWFLHHAHNMLSGIFQNLCSGMRTPAYLSRPLGGDYRGVFLCVRGGGVWSISDLNNILINLMARLDCEMIFRFFFYPFILNWSMHITLCTHWWGDSMCGTHSDAQFFQHVLQLHAHIAYISQPGTITVSAIHILNLCYKRNTCKGSNGLSGLVHLSIVYYNNTQWINMGEGKNLICTTEFFTYF